MKRRFSLVVALFFLFISGTVEAKKSSPSGPPYSPSELRKLVAPIALYPDPLLAQILPASTYPLEIVEAARLIHSEKDEALIDRQNWDASVKAVAHYPSLLEMMDEKLQWTQALGQAFLSQQQDVLQAVQDLRAQAQESGNLKNTEQQRIVQSEDGIEIVPTNPQLVYVPDYDSELVYTTSASDWAVPLISFGFGYALGSWLNTCFYWPDYSVVYGGPYYWGWGRPYWNHYPWGWNQWGWNHWGPRPVGGNPNWWNPNWNPGHGSVPNPLPPPPTASNPWKNPNPGAFPWGPKNTQPVGWKHDDSHGGPFWGGGPNGSSWGRPMPGGNSNSGQKTWGSNPQTWGSPPPSNAGNWGGWKNQGSNGSHPSNGNSGPKSWGNSFAPSHGPSNNWGSNTAPVSTMRMGGMNVKPSNYSPPPAPMRTPNASAPSAPSGGGRPSSGMGSPGFQKSMGGWGGGGGHWGSSGGFGGSRGGFGFRGR